MKVCATIDGPRQLLYDQHGREMSVSSNFHNSLIQVSTWKMIPGKNLSLTQGERAFWKSKAAQRRTYRRSCYWCPSKLTRGARFFSHKQQRLLSIHSERENPHYTSVHEYFQDHQITHAPPPRHLLHPGPKPETEPDSTLRWLQQAGHPRTKQRQTGE